MKVYLPNKGKIYHGKEWLDRKYWGEKLSLKQIGEEVGVCSETINKWMKRNRVPRRSYKEAGRVMWREGHFDIEGRNKKLGESVSRAWKSGTFDNDQWRERQAIARRKAWKRGDYEGSFGDECKRRHKKAAKQAWARGDYDGVFKSPSQLELAVASVFDQLGIRYETQFRFPDIGYKYDFRILGKRLLVEVDGWFWHSSSWAKEHGKVEVDCEKDKLAKEQGYQLVRLMERDMEDHGIQKVVKGKVMPLIQ